MASTGRTGTETTTQAGPGAAGPGAAEPATAGGASADGGSAGGGPADGGSAGGGSAGGGSADGGPVAAPVRPSLSGRAHYLVGGTLPARHRDWVAADLTGPGWRPRQAARQAALMAPFAIIFAILPGPVVLRVTLAVFLLLAGLGLGFATSGAFRDRRLRAHGLPVPKRARRLSEDDYLDAQEREAARSAGAPRIQNVQETQHAQKSRGVQETPDAPASSHAREQVPGVQDPGGLGDRTGQ